MNISFRLNDYDYSLGAYRKCVISKINYENENIISKLKKDIFTSPLSGMFIIFLLINFGPNIVRQFFSK